MRKLASSIAITPIALFGVLVLVAQPAALATVTYDTTSDNFANPERGLYHNNDKCITNDFNVAILQKYRTGEKISLVMCVFYLTEFKNTAISNAALSQLKKQLNTIRVAGLKVILRFAYTKSMDGDDATKAKVLEHLGQLKQYLNLYKDVIYVMQAGFIGAWGEWYYTKNFGNADKVTAADTANRKAVMDKILSVVPSIRMVQLRIPKYKLMYSSTYSNTVTSGQAYGGSTLARIGHHNDCFLAKGNDQGTYTNTTVEYPYLEAETQFVAMGGETCEPNPPHTNCPYAKKELSRFHWSYLNIDYKKSVLDGWKTEGCLAQITRSLGYRFVLQSGTYPSTVKRGGVLSISINLKNEGYAAPFNPRGLELVLRKPGAVYPIPLLADPRKWAAGVTSKISENVKLNSNIPSGSYELLLNLPDPLLAQRREYSIRLANKNTWDETTGMNKLLHTVKIV